MKESTNDKVSTNDLSTEAVMAEYVNIVNEAISKRSDTWPVGKMIELGDKALDNKKFGVAIYRDDAGSPHDYFTLKFDGGRLSILSHGKRDPDFAWKASESYLRGVVAERDKYVESPAKLDFDWLKDRTGIN